MTPVTSRAELTKLARTLDLPQERLEFLGKLPPVVLRHLRENISASLFDRQAGVLKRIASASRLLPIGLLAVIAEKVFGPLLCARVAGFISPERAIDISARLPTPFLTEVTLTIDPRRARELVASFPVERVVEIALALFARHEYVTMGRFVDVLRKPALKAILARMDDDEALLRVAVMIESKAKLNEVVGLLPEQRLREVIQAAAGSDDDLWPEALALMASVDERMQQHLAVLMSSMGEPVIRSLAASAKRNELWPLLLPLAKVVDDDSLQRLARHLPQMLEHLDAGQRREIQKILSSHHR